MSSLSSRIKRAFSLFRTAVAGTEQEFTSGSIDRAIFLLAVPMILEMIMESLFAVVDIYFVGKLGKEAVTTVGLTESVVSIIFSVGIGLAMAATAVVARRTGEGDADGAARSAVAAIVVGGGVSIVLSVLGVVFAKDILLLMGEDPALVDAHIAYPRIIYGSNVVIILLFLINGIFRGAGDASVAMRTLWIANGLNIVLCPLLIHGLGSWKGMGLEGAAWATTIGRSVGVGYQLFRLRKGTGSLQILRRHWRIEVPLVSQILKIGAGGTGQFLINSASWIVLARIVSSFGEAAVAGYTIGIRVLVFTVLPAWGISNAAATLVGQNLGAGNPERAEKSVWRTAQVNVIFMGLVTLIYWLAAEPIVRFFSQDPEVVRYGMDTLRFVCSGYVFFAYSLVVLSSFNGAGDTRTPTLLNICAFWLFQIPLAWLLAMVLDWGPQGVFWAITISESCLAIAAIVVFRQGKWKTVRV
jgi:putative MATE family efflux protein